MNNHAVGISGRCFTICLIVIGICLSAFPVYQAFKTDGLIFYTTNVDEASHLSFWYANYVVEESGRLRVSSRLVRLLHNLGVSGGYINFGLDIAASFVLIFSLVRIYRTLGCSYEQARLASLLTFISPLFFTCFNPLLAMLNELRLSTDLVRWLSMPQNSEIVYLRSPEPQVSWAILAFALSRALRARTAALIGIITSPLLYPFVKLPTLFVSAAYLISSRFGYSVGLPISFLAIGLGTFAFVHVYAAPSLLQFFIFSHLPVFSLVGLLSGIFLLAIYKHIPAHIVQLCGLLVASIWATENVQLISGWLVTPVNYEQYWGVFVLAVLTAFGVTFRATRPLLWLGVGMGGFVLHITSLFLNNAPVLGTLKNREEILRMLPTQAARVACDNVYLATYLDLAFPKQDPTALSWTRTLHASNNVNYLEYLCVKAAIQKLPQAQQSRFSATFARLESGYSCKGSDLNVTMGRQQIVRAFLPTPAVGSKCPETPLVTNIDPLDQQTATFPAP